MATVSVIGLTARYFVVFFAEGVGKGVVGVVALPASGVIDFGSHAFESVHR